MNKLKDFENILIIGDNKNVYISCFSKEQVKSNSPAKIMRFLNDKLPCDGNELYSRDTNSLYVVNKFLVKVSQLINTENDNCATVKIYVGDSLYKKIVNGVFKYWINTGMTKTGVKLDAKELQEWIAFAKLYNKVFTKVEFANKTVYSARQFKYNQEEMRYGQIINESLNKKLEKLKENEINESILENIQ